MLLSMTGFGRGSAVNADQKITVEVKSLNSKQLDLVARVPSSLRSLEPAMRTRIAEALERGKVELAVIVEHIGHAVTAHLDVEAMQAYKQQFEQAASKLGLPAPADWYAVLLRMPDVLTSDNEYSSADEPSPAMQQAVFAALDQALKQLNEYRRAEGRKLEQFFAVRIKGISDLLAEVPHFEAERIDRIKAKLADGLSKIAVADYDKGRLEQEMIYYIEKLDVNEERQRLAQHLAYFTETMDQPTPGQGKKLGFIAQEMGREINTLGSKSNHADMQRLVVRMKDLLEQIKEQVLNVM